MKKSFLFVIIYSLLFTFSTVSSQEHLIVSGEDSLVISNEEIPMKVLEKMQSHQFGTIEKIYSEAPYGVFVFNDEDRRVFKNSDEIQIIFNEDSLTVNSLENIFYKNSGPDKILNVKVIPSFQGETLNF